MSCLLSVQIGLKGTTQNHSIHCIQHHQAFMGECQITCTTLPHKCDSVSTQIQVHLGPIMQATVTQNEGERFGSTCYMIAVNIYLGRQRREGGEFKQAFSCCVCPNSEVAKWKTYHWQRTWWNAFFQLRIPLPSACLYTKLDMTSFTW